MTPKQFLEKHSIIILNALEDYKRWFDEGSENYNVCSEAIKDLGDLE